MCDGTLHCHVFIVFFLFFFSADCQENEATSETQSGIVPSAVNWMSSAGRNSALSAIVIFSYFNYLQILRCIHRALNEAANEAAEQLKAN